MKIAVLRALQLGDLLCAVPALRALRARYPAARVTLIGLPWARDFAARFRRYLDDFIEFPGFPGLPERTFHAQALPRFFRQAREQRFDLAIQMHGSGEIMNPITVLTGARRTAGFYRPGRFCPDAQRYLDWRESEHEVLRYLRLMRQLAIPPQGSALEFPLEDHDWREWTHLGLERGAYAVVHPGSQLPSRRWPAERFAKVADALASEGLQVVLTGTRAEAVLTTSVTSAMRAPALNLAGLTTLGGLAALIARARLLIANDTGVSHIAAAVNTPSVIVACGSDPQRWTPLDRQRHRLIYHWTDCRPCLHAVCPIGHPCAHGVPVERVIHEALSLVECVA